LSALFGAIASALKPGCRFVLESGAVSESILPVLQPERTLRIGDLDFLSRNTYDAVDGRMDITYTFIRGQQREVKPIHQWVHSAAEIHRMAPASWTGAARRVRRCGRRLLYSRLRTIHRACQATSATMTSRRVTRGHERRAFPP
jgi:hypothetical protein